MTGSALPPTSAAAPEKASEPVWIERAKWLIATLAIPLALAWIAHEFSDQQAKRDAKDRDAADVRSLRDSRLRTYTELLNKREEADMNVRKEIFSTLLGNYFDRSTGDKASATKGELTRRMTVLELLASNFDESLDLSPLFWQLDRDLTTIGGATQQEIRGRLSQLADDVKRRQIAVLEASGGQQQGIIALDSPEALGKPIFDEPIRLGSLPLGAARVHGCRFEVTLIEHDASRHRVYVTVQTYRLNDAAQIDDSCVKPGSDLPKQWTFWVDEFDFPLITYARLSTTERFAVVMSSYDPKQARAMISLVYFPSSRSGARDRPFLDTVVDSLNAPIDSTPTAAPASAAPR